MKPTFKTTALAILISLGAVACGSSGGGDSSSTEQKQPVVKENPKPQKQENNLEKEKLQAQINALQKQLNASEEALKKEKENSATEHKKTTQEIKTSNDKLQTLETKITEYESNLAALNKQYNKIRYKELFEKARNAGMSEKKADEFAEKYYKDKDHSAYKKVLRDLKIVKEATHSGMNEKEVAAFVEKHKNDEDIYAYRKELRDRNLIRDAGQAGMTKDELDDFLKRHRNDTDPYAYQDELIQRDRKIKLENAGMSKQEAQKFAELFDTSEYEKFNNALFIYNTAIQDGLDKKTALDIAQTYGTKDELNNIQSAFDKIEEIKKENIAKQTEIAQKERADFVGEKTSKEIILDDGFTEFAPSKITADGYTRSKERGYTSDSQEGVDENNKPTSTSYRSYVYNLENAGIELSEASFSGYKGSYKNGSKLAYAGYPTKAEALKSLTGTATYSGKAFVAETSSYVRDKDIDDATVSLTADFNKKAIKGEINYYFNYPEKSQIKLENGTIQAKNDQIVFNGKATSGDYKGNYEGKFMGKEAKQLAGSAQLSKKQEYSSEEKLNAVFVAEKQ
ncbi:hypothetical protein HPC38_09910 [Pasteurellaceae bacterium HPA106]|uniref:transferrin-binding protein-like solute binding protein n=1 Tax=Spirabiliibacterium pneumoniae TaxID=221400 RepID=UPI001AACA52A|nr:transferrin-binding protein-like solute binding protein [Spirabiliibacterium pneumoniae]MBE2897179.1 hypothetical protein [Spirabiliibacterium pneumoniae]